jgi:hypothetical protein
MTYSDAQLEAAAHALWAEFNYTLPTDPGHIAKIVLDAAAAAA